MRRCAIRPTPDWSDFRDEFLEFYAPPNYPSATWWSVKRVLDVIEELGLKSLADLRPRLVSKFCARRTGKGGRPIVVRTVETQFVYFRLLCEYAAGQGYIPIDPTKARKRWISDGGSEFKGRFLSAAETEAIRRRAEAEAADGDWVCLRNLVVFELLAGLGLRRAEALGLPLCDVNLGDQTILIRRNPRRRCKTKESEAYLPIPDRNVELFDKWSRMCGPLWFVPAFDRGHMGKPWFYGGKSSRPLEQIKGLGLRAGVPNVNFMVFRHTWATEAELRGASNDDIQKVLRHTTPLTAKEFYRHAGVAAMRGVVELVNRPAAPAPPLRIIGAQA
jgi:integrase